MADTNNASIKTSVRVYCAAVGDLEWWGGIRYKDGTWSTKYRDAVIATYKETTTVERGLKYRDGKPADPTGAALEKRTVSFIRGSRSTDNYVYATFDYEYSSTTVTVSRVNEAGFYEKTTVIRVCTDIKPDS